MTTAEYNHGYSAVQKNALDHVFAELSRKPIALRAAREPVTDRP